MMPIEPIPRSLDTISLVRPALFSLRIPRYHTSSKETLISYNSWVLSDRGTGLQVYYKRHRSRNGISGGHGAFSALVTLARPMPRPWTSQTVAEGEFIKSQRYWSIMKKKKGYAVATMTVTSRPHTSFFSMSLRLGHSDRKRVLSGCCRMERN
jgi:hypothetical protein